MQRYKVTVEILVEATSPKDARIAAEWYRLQPYNNGQRKGPTLRHDVVSIEKVSGEEDPS